MVMEFDLLASRVLRNMSISSSEESDMFESEDSLSSYAKVGGGSWEGRRRLIDSDLMISHGLVEVGLAGRIPSNLEEKIRRGLILGLTKCCLRTVMA